MSIKGGAFCERKGKMRISFKTKEKADFLIEHYDELMDTQEGWVRPIRSFYCPSCNLWHITHVPLEPELAWKEERDQKVQELQTLAGRLKTEFRQADWKAWELIVEEGLNLLDSFKERHGFEKLVEDTGKQLRHCAAIIKTCEAKENGSADEDFKRIRKGIEHSAKALDYITFESEVYRLVRYFRNASLRKALVSPNLEWLTQITVCMEDGETMGFVSQVMEQAHKSVPDSRDVDAEDLYNRVLNMTLWMDKLFVLGLPRTVWDILRSKVKKIASVLENSFGSTLSPDGFPLMEKVRIIASERMLSEAAACEDNELTLSMLQYTDARIHQITFSKKKLELMKQVCEIGEKVF